MIFLRQSILLFELSASFIRTYHTNERCSDGPTQLPKHEWVVANHVFDAIIKSVYSKCPRNSDAFKEDQEQEAEATHGV